VKNYGNEIQILTSNKSVVKATFWMLEASLEAAEDCPPEDRNGLVSLNGAADAFRRSSRELSCLCWLWSVDESCCPSCGMLMLFDCNNGTRLEKQRLLRLLLSLTN
jgi:hypothetical protein